MTAGAIRSGLFVAIVVCFAVACSSSGGDPDDRTADWEENFDKANHASEAGRHGEAIDIAQAYLKKHPDNVDAHRMVGDALLAAAEAATDSSRPTQFTEAAKHYDRTLELTHNSNWRLLSVVALVRIYGEQGLNKPDESIRYARMLVANEPNDLNNRSMLLTLLARGHKFDDAAAFVAETQKVVPPTEEAWAKYGGMVHDLVATTPGFPPSTGLTLAADASGQIDQALTKFGRTKKLLLAKGMLLRAQGNLDTDTARQRALLDESKRVFDEMDRLAP